MAIFCSLVFFPTEPGSYVPMVFVPGVHGAVYTELYTDVLTQLATHGYIVVGLDLKWPISKTGRITVVSLKTQKKC